MDGGTYQKYSTILKYLKISNGKVQISNIIFIKIMNLSISFLHDPLQQFMEEQITCGLMLSFSEKDLTELIYFNLKMRIYGTDRF